MSSGVVVLGVLNGLLIGLLAAGFVLVYRASKFLNLAHAQLGAVSSLLLVKLVLDLGWSFWVALLLCIPAGAGIGIVVERFLIRPLRARTSSPVRLLMLTIGVSQLLLALTFMPFLAPGSNAFQAYPQPFRSSLQVGGVVVSGMALLTLFTVPALLLALTWFLGRTTLGKQIRAAANNPEAAQLCGISLDRVGTVTWGIAGGLSAVSAILNGPNAISSNPAAIGPSLLFFTIGAAAFGAFTSIPAAVGGGLALGVTFQVVAAVTNDSGEAFLAVFMAIVGVIVVRGKAIGRVFATSGAPIPERPAIRVPHVLRSNVALLRAPWWLGGAMLLVALVLPRLPFLRQPGHQFQLTLIVIYALVGVSVTMLTGWGGQVSLGNFALLGLGAFLTAGWVADGWTLTTMVLVAGLIGAGVTTLIGVPALRVPGLTLAVTTLGFAVLCPQYLYLQSWVGGDTPFTTPVTRPDLSALGGRVTSPAHVYYVTLTALVLALLAAGALRRSAAGRAMLAVRDNERASAAFGLSTVGVKVSLLAVSGFIAASAGVFWAIAWQRVSPDQFGPEVSIAILAIPVIGGLGSLSGAVVGAVILYGGTFFLAPHLAFLLGPVGQNAGFLLLLAGSGVVGTMFQFPNGIAGAMTQKWQAYLDMAGARVEEQLAEPTAGLALAVRDVAVHFGGVVAVNGVDIDVRQGEIVGLIGGNGAGKTTLVNVISGLLTPDRGSVRVYGHEVADLPADARASYGLARSFQDASLFAGLTVSETIQLALSRGSKTGVLPAMLGAPWVRAAGRDSRRQADVIVTRFGLQAYADSMASELSTGTRRICDLAAQVAARPKVLVLDEPTGGVAQREAEAFGPLLRRIRDELDCAIVIIEHDMPLLMGLCDRIYAMEAGQVIAVGTPTEVRDDPRVIASYLGTDETAIDRSSGRRARKRPVKPTKKPAALGS